MGGGTPDKKAKEIIHHLVERRKNHIDASQFDDGVALSTEWEALKVSSSSFDNRSDMIRQSIRLSMLEMGFLG